MTTTTIVRMTLKTISSLKEIRSLTYGVPALLLKGVEPGVEAVRGDELVVGSFFRDSAVFKDQDLVHVPDQPQLVGDNEGGTALGEHSPVGIDSLGGLGVESCLRLVEDQDKSVP